MSSVQAAKLKDMNRIELREKKKRDKDNAQAERVTEIRSSHSDMGGIPMAQQPLGQGFARSGNMQYGFQNQYPVSYVLYLSVI